MGWNHIARRREGAVLTLLAHLHRFLGSPYKGRSSLGMYGTRVKSVNASKAVFLTQKRRLVTCQRDSDLTLLTQMGQAATNEGQVVSQHTTCRERAKLSADQLADNPWHDL